MFSLPKKTNLILIHFHFMTQIIITTMTMIVIMLTLLPSRKVEILSASTSPLEEPPSMPQSTATKMNRWV